jgi:transcriptional antiterminator RfaH
LDIDADDKPDGGTAVKATDSLWHVLHVRPRCQHDLPLREETKIYQRRRVTVWKPVFPGYVFVVFDPTERVTLLKSNVIVRILHVADQKQLIHELAQIRQALCVDPTLDACAAFTAGRRVLISGGPFQGLEGIIRTLRGKTRVVLNVEMIGRAVAVEVDIGFLEPVE